MWGFTKQEQRAIAFLLVAFVIGCSIMFYRKRLPPPPVNPAEVEKFREYVAALRDTARPDSAIRTAIDSTMTAEIGQPGAVILNAATVDELMAVPGIGKVIATRIIEYRDKHGPFKSIDELTKVKGIGKKKLADLNKALVIQ